MQEKIGQIATHLVLHFAGGVVGCSSSPSPPVIRLLLVNSESVKKRQIIQLFKPVSIEALK